MGIEDVDTVEPESLQRGVEAGQQVLAAAARTAVGAGMHAPAGLGRDDEFVAVGTEVFAQQTTEVRLGGPWRGTVVVREIEVRDAQIEGPAHDVALILECHVIAEIVPQAQRQRGQDQPGSADRAVGHRIVAVIGCLVHGASCCGNGFSGAVLSLVASDSGIDPRSTAEPMRIRHRT